MARPQAPVGAPKEAPGASDYRMRLEALRDDLTATMADTGARDKASLAGQLRAVLRDLAAIPDVSEASAVDDLAVKRARRRSAASAS